MNDDRHELISAYLDGEATPEERARVERLLAEDDKARRLHDELRALSATLQSLPRERLDEAFADQVLRRAERTVLTQDPPRDEDDHHSGGGGWGGTWSFPFGRSARGWAWAALAIAAALLVMIFSPDQDAEVARNAPLPPPQGRMAAPRGEEAEGGRRRPNEGAEAPAAAQPPDRADGQQNAAAPEAAMRRAPAAPARASQAAPPAVAMKAEPAAPRPEAVMEKNAAPKVMMLRAAPAMSRAMMAAPRTGGNAEARLNRQIEQLGRAGVLVVRLDASRQAVAGRALEKLFAKKSIAVEEKSPLSLSELAGQAASRPPRPKIGAPPEPAGERPAPQALVGRAHPAPAAGDGPRDLQLMYVEAPLEAVEATLAALAAKPGEFPVIKVEPAEDKPRQQALLAYRRGQSAGGLGMRKMRAAAPLKAPTTQRLRIAPVAPKGAKPQVGQAQTSQAQSSQTMRVLFVLRVLPKKKQASPVEKP